LTTARGVEPRGDMNVGWNCQSFDRNKRLLGCACIFSAGHPSPMGKKRFVPGIITASWEAITIDGPVG